MITKTKNYNHNYQISINFKMREFISSDGYAIWNNEIAEFVIMVQKFRTWYGRPINPSSWFRTLEHNNKIGGSKNSEHLRGTAIDIRYPQEFYSFTPSRKDEFVKNIENKWREICKSHGKIGSIEICDRHFHLDIRPWANGQFKLYYGTSK